MEDATALGFPSISLSTKILGNSWDASVYAGLHQFHQAKGFDPDSQDVARHLGQSLYQLLSETDAPFAHGKSVIPRKIVLFD
jgi:sigma54-dependent transcription regulator